MPMNKIKVPYRPEEFWIIVSTDRFDDICPYLRATTVSLLEKTPGYEFKKTPFLFHAQLFSGKEVAENFIKLYELPAWFVAHRIIITSG